MNKNQLTSESIISRSESLLSNNLGDDVVMMDIEEGSYYGLEAVAASIWKLTEKPISFGSLCERLTDEYDVAPERCHTEVKAFVDSLLERKIVQISS